MTPRGLGGGAPQFSWRGLWGDGVGSASSNAERSIVQVQEEEVPIENVSGCETGLSTRSGACLQGFQMVEVPGGGFVAGGVGGPFSLERRRAVVLPNSVWINHTEVTQQQFEAVMGFNPAETCSSRLGPTQPVNCVSH